MEQGPAFCQPALHGKRRIESMKTNVSIIAAAVLATVIAGCGGSGSGGGAQAPPTPEIGRLMVGYVWVKENAGQATGPDIMITGSTTAPEGYFAPESGTITLHVDDGSLIGRAPDDYVRNMVDGNDIIVAAESVSPYLVTVTAAGLTYQGQAKSTFGNALATYSENLSLGGASGTTLVMASPGSPIYTPGEPASVRLTVNGGPAPTELISGGTYSLAVAFFDINGIAIPGLTPNVTSSDAARVSISGTYDLNPAAASSLLAPGDVTVRAALPTNAQVAVDFTANFNYGDVTTVAVAPTGPTDLLWEEAGPAATMNLTVTVNNQFAAPMFDEAITWSNSKAPGNVWDTTSGGPCFSATSGNSDGSGQMTVTISAPVSAPGPLVGADKNPKGLNDMTATAGAINGVAVVNIIRPMGAVTIDGPARLDVGTVSPSIGSNSIRVTGALDVDNDPVASPGGVTWQITNVAGSGNVGNTGDGTPQSTSASTINPVTGVVTAGGIAGQIEVEAVSGSVTSNTLTIEVFGVPAKVFFAPDTQATAIPGAAGEYAGSPGGQQAFTVSVIDSWGHALPIGELAGFTTSSSTDSLSGANITPGGPGVASFTVTFGSGDGTFTIGTSGSWSGAMGGGPQSFSITRVTGLNVP